MINLANGNRFKNDLVNFERHNKTPMPVLCDFLTQAYQFYSESDIEDKEFREMRVDTALDIYDESLRIYTFSYPKDPTPETLLDTLRRFIKGSASFDELDGIRRGLGNGSRHEAYISFQRAGHFGHTNYHELKDAYIAVSVIAHIVDCIAYDLSGRATGSVLNTTPEYSNAVSNLSEIINC